MLTKQTLKWQDPLDLACQISISNYQENWIFLYSGLHKKIKNSKSYLGLYPKKEIIAGDFKELEQALLKSQDQYFGYLSYNLKNQLENLSSDQKSFINLPDLWLISFGLILEFDHDKKVLHQYNCGNIHLDSIATKKATTKNYPSIKSLKSNFSKTEYLEKAQQIRRHCQNGDIYQANLTRKFFGKFNQKPDNPFEIFLKLNQASPANYSTFLSLGKNYLISSSPELFLKINRQGKVISSPIKGTAPRFKNKQLDLDAKKTLQNSSKEQAENLMIVDLVRNDLSKHCSINSIRVDNLFKVSSYKTVHHLSSDIIGTKNFDSNVIDVVKGCFPPGSMTGAPKIKAMEICSNLERLERGVYSGAIGLIDQTKCALSVVIRTIIIQGDKFEFQVGGAITFDSDPKKEWQETINKSKAMAKVLGIKLNQLKEL